MWGETIQTDQHLESMLYPRLFAFAERAWHNASWEEEQDDAAKREDYTRFITIVGQQELPRLEAAGIEYYLPPPGVKYVNLHIMQSSRYSVLRHFGQHEP